MFRSILVIGFAVVLGVIMPMTVSAGIFDDIFSVNVTVDFGSDGIISEDDPDTLDLVTDQIADDITLPSGDLATDLAPAIIKFILTLTAVIITGIMIYSGVLYVISQGDEEMRSKALKLITYGILGIGMVGLAYGFILAVTRLDFSVL